jgi:hypothetical protein
VRPDLLAFAATAKQVSPKVPRLESYGRPLALSPCGLRHDGVRPLYVERPADLANDHLEGGGALSGGSKRSKAIADVAANAFPNMRPSPTTRLAATI